MLMLTSELGPVQRRCSFSHLTTSLDCRQVTTENSQRARNLDGFTARGAIAVMANALAFVAFGVRELQLEFMKGQPDSFIANGFIFSSTTGLQHVMDSIANFCQDAAPNDRFTGVNIYFSSYEFISQDVRWIHASQQAVIAMRFRTHSFNEIANSLKHDAPWLGLPSRNRDDVWDIYEDCVRVDEQRRLPVLHGYLTHMLVPAYKTIRSILARLGDQNGITVNIPNL
jgi:hypothetical protein